MLLAVSSRVRKSVLLVAYVVPLLDSWPRSADASTKQVALQKGIQKALKKVLRVVDNNYKPLILK